ncbi:MAG TPA: ORF6N domain-containing protein [Lacunisphaera sp.]
MSRSSLLPVESIQQRILIIRGKRVLLDADLARYYGVATKALNEAVARNPDRFPDDFSFQLTRVEMQNLMSQFETSSSGAIEEQSLARKRRTHGGTRKPARVFTQEGVAMLASVLRSKRAVNVSVAIVRAFVRLREMLADNRELAAKVSELERKIATHDGAIRELFDAIRQLLLPPPARHREIGFHTTLRRGSDKR